MAEFRKVVTKTTPGNREAVEYGLTLTIGEAKALMQYLGRRVESQSDDVSSTYAIYSAMSDMLIGS